VIKIIRFDQSGRQQSAIELDEFTVEILYSGITKMLDGASAVSTPPAATAPLSREARRRRARILSRIDA
jgi:hypothetical protein